MRKASSFLFPGNFYALFIPLIAGLLLSFSVRAQNFNYSFAKDSVAWQELNTQTILNANNSDWNFAYRIPIGFSFNYLGRNFDSLTIETNGYLVFDEDRNYALTAFLGFGDCIDLSGNHSVLGYSLSGTIGNRILKIQFKNVATVSAGNTKLSYQIWLCEESNRIEIRTGPENANLQNSRTNIVSVLEVMSTAFENVSIVPLDSIHIDSEAPVRIGLLNMNIDALSRGYFIDGDPSHPEAQLVTNQSVILPGLATIPRQGMKYTFQPASN